MSIDQRHLKVPDKRKVEYTVKLIKSSYIRRLQTDSKEILYVQNKREYQ